MALLRFFSWLRDVGQGGVGFLDQVRGNGADVVGEVHILGEALDHDLGLGERCSTLEDQVLRVRLGEQVVQSPDDPYVLLEQMQGAARTLCCDEQRLALVLARQLQKLRHEAPAR